MKHAFANKMSINMRFLPAVFLCFVYSGVAYTEVESPPSPIYIEKGMSLDQVAQLLKEKGLIKSGFYFKLLARIQGKSEQVKSGEYVFQKKLSSQEILNVLVRGQTRLYRVTFPEGYNMYEMANLLDKGQFLKKEAFIALCQNPDFVYEILGEQRLDLEGYLFPDTYYIPRSIRPKVLIQQMVQNFFKTYESINTEGLPHGVLQERQQVRHDGSHEKQRKGPVGTLSRHELVILASIVEKETGLSQERPLIAGVFYNRLKKGMRLESDPTILYGMMREKGGLVELNIRKKDILRKTPYNTYRIPRFPIGPIGNPGAGALKAVLEPAQSAFLYFVSRNDGSHVFSKNYKAHQKAVDRYQKRPRVMKPTGSSGRARSAGDP